MAESFPLSSQQRRLWFLADRYGGDAFAAGAVLCLRGAVDVDALRDAVQQVTWRHEILRTAFESVEWMKVPQQTIRSQAEPAWVPEASEQQGMLWETPESFLQNGIGGVSDRTHGQPLKIQLHQRSKEEYWLGLWWPGLYLDRQSLTLLIQDLGCAYGGSVGDEEPLQYVDYVDWQLDLREDVEIELLQAFWNRRNVWELRDVALPIREPEADSFVPRWARLPVPLDLHRERMVELGRSTDAAPVDVLLAGWQMLMARWTERPDVPVGRLLDGRKFDELQDGLGLYASCVPIRGDLSDRPSFQDLVSRVVAESREAREWQEVGIPEKIAGEDTRDLWFPFLFEVEKRSQGFEFGGIDAHLLTSHVLTEPFTVKLVCVEENGALTAELLYDREAVTRASAERLGSALERILQQGLERPGSPVDGFDVLGNDERAQLLVDFNDTDREMPESSFPVLFEQEARRVPDRVALVHEELWLSYGHLFRRSRSLARQLRDFGLQPEDRVALCARRSSEAILWMLGVLQAGATYVFLDPAHPAQRRLAMVESGSPRLILTEARFAGDFGSFPGRVLVPGQDASLAELMEKSSPRESHAEEPLSESLAYVLFTSGSTGRPKGVAVEHRQLRNYLHAICQRLEAPDASSFATVSTLAADLGNTMIFPALATGGTLHVISEERLADAESLSEYFEQRPVDYLKIVPSHLEALLSSRQGAWALPRKRLILGGEVASPELLLQIQERAPRDFVVMNHYGPTETTVGVTTHLWNPREAKQSLPLGEPLANIQLYLLDGDQVPVPMRIPGELYVGGDNVTRGYLGQARQTAERFVPNPWSRSPGGRLYRTGDSALFQEDGSLHFRGRVDSQIQVRGFRVEPREIESVLENCPGISRAIAMLWDQDESSRLVAYVVPKEEAQVSEEELRSSVSEQLPDYMVPSVITILETLPLDANGKVDRSALPNPELRERAHFEAPRNPMEEVIQSIWMELLASERVGIHDDFFQLGGHSLLATQAISRLRQTFEIELPINAMFEHPTVASMAAEMRVQLGLADVEAAPQIRRADRDQALPLSFSQQRLWFLHQLDPRSPAYNSPRSLRLRGDLRMPVVVGVVSEMVRRQEVLRTRFPAQAGSAVQHIEPAGSCSVVMIDLSRLDPEVALHQARRLAREEALRPFDLATETPLRLRWLQLDDESHVLLFTMHHIAGDMWSLRVLDREVAGAFEALTSGRPTSLPELPVQYADYAVWQRSWLRGGVLDRHLDYWLSQLEGVPPTLDLPVDRRRPPKLSDRGATYRFALPARTSHLLERVSRDNKSTPFMVVLSTFHALLARYAGQSDFAIGVPVAGRDRLEVEDLIGFFVNTLAIRLDLRGMSDFQELLANTRRTVLEAFAHQDLPFELLVDEMQVPRDLSRSPLFQTMFEYRRQGGEGTLQLPNIGVEGLGSEAEIAKFELRLTVWEQTEGLHGAINYSTDLFDETSIRRMWKHFESCLIGFLEEPLQPVFSLALLSRAERHQMLHEWNARISEPSSGLPLTEIFAAQVESQPDAVAVVFQDQHLSYGELQSRARGLAKELRSSGVGRGDRVGVELESSAELVTALLGVLESGAAYVPLDPVYPKDRRDLVLQDSGASAVVDRERVAEVAPWPKDASWKGWGTGSGDLAYVIYTSGSTGRPKGVLIPHGHVERLLATCAGDFRFGRRDVWTLFHSYAFDFSVWELWGPLLEGGRLVVVPYWVGRSPSEFRSLLAEERVTVLNQTPSAFRPLVQRETEVGGDGLESLCWIVFGGEALEMEALRPWFEIHGEASPRLVNMYGITETTVHVTYRPLSASDLAKPGRIGRALGDLESQVLDRNLQPVPLGVVGEICVGGAGLAWGYLGRPDLTAERFVPHPFAESPGERLYRSGDLARWRPAGDLEYQGRLDHQIKVRGFRVELGEIEAALTRLPEVREAAVTIAESAAGSGTRLVAYWVPTVGADATTTELRRGLAEQLPAYMLPSIFVPMEELPKTTSGKFDRAHLPEPDAWRAESTQDVEPPRTDAERRLAAIWSTVLGVEHVGRRDNFFELGGDSILAIQVVSRAQAVGLHLTPRQVFEAPALRDLARLSQETRHVTVDQGPVVGPVPLTPIQRYFFDQKPLYPHHNNQSVLLVSEAPVDAAALRTAVDRLVEHHDALRLRFRKTSRSWEQEHVESIDTSPVTEVDLSNQGSADWRATLQEHAAATQASLDLEKGPIFRVILYRLGSDEPDRVLFVVHHLAVDGVSWRILMEDFQALYDQLLRGESVRLPNKTTSFRAWAERLVDWSTSTDLLDELDFWLNEDRRGIRPLPIDEIERGGDNVQSSTSTVVRTLEDDESRALLSEVPEVYRTQINDVLLTAAALGFRDWTGDSRLLVALEGHGREEVFDGVDLSRTVGWFTSVFPALLSLPTPPRYEQALKSIKEQLRSIPRRGLGYGVLRYLSTAPKAGGLRSLPPPEISFNYLGQVDQVLPKDSAWGAASESKGPARNPAEHRRYLLDVSAIVAGGRLRLSIRYSENLHRRETMERLADRIVQGLRDLLEHCRSPEAGGVTPSDFPLLDIGQDDLDRALEQVVFEGVPPGFQAIEDAYPLSPLQEGMLFHSMYESGASDLYVCQNHYTLQSPDVDALQEAWRRVSWRHAVLRTAFASTPDGRAIQVVGSRVAPSLEVVDWRHLEPSRRDERLRSLLAEDRRRGFDLSRAPLVRLTLIQWDDGVCRLLWTHHHILMDGWSVPLVLRDFSSIYRSLCEGSSLEIGEARPYRDYIAFLQERDPLDEEVFWKNCLQGITEPTPLRIGSATRQAPRPQEVDRLQERSRLSADRLATLRKVAQRRRLTLNDLIQGAWAILLSRYSDRKDVVFGAVVSGRRPELEGIENMVGLLINTLPVRHRIDLGRSLGDWLTEVQKRQMDVREHEHTALAQIQAWSDVPGGRPLFDSLLVFENYPVDPEVGRGVEDLEIRKIGAMDVTHYPLVLAVSAGREMSIVADAVAERFQASDVRRLVEHLRTLLLGVPECLEAPVSAWGHLRPEERHQVLREWNDTARSYSSEGGLAALIGSVMESAPDRTAVVFQDQHLSYGELQSRARGVARDLRAVGIGPGDQVVVRLDRGIELVSAMWGVLEAGAAYVPVDPAYPEDRREVLVEDSGASAVVDLERMAATAPWPRDAEWQTTGVTPDHLAYVIYTSGSTGRPKGVMVPRGALEHLTHSALRGYDLRPDDRALQFASVSFDSSVEELFPPLAVGATVVLRGTEALDSRDFLRRCQDQAVTFLTLPTAFWHVLAEDLEQADLEWPSSVHSTVIGGERADARRLESWHARTPKTTTLFNTYGPTEGTVVATRWLDVGVVPSEMPIGRAIDRMKAYVVDRRGEPQPIGVAGELVLAGAGLATGYLGKPRKTAEVFAPNPFASPGSRMYFTGDLARWCSEGHLEFLGRVDRQVKVRGFRVEPGEIESVLNELDSVRESVVVVREPSGDARLVAYVVGEVEETTLRQHLRDRLPPQMEPSQFVFMESLPWTPNDKIDHDALPAPSATGFGETEDFVAPRGPAEELVAAIWEDVLGVEHVGVEHDFFELGGHSLLAMRVMTRLREIFRVELPIRRLFDRPTLGSLVLALADTLGNREVADEVARTYQEIESLSDEEIRSLLAEETSGEIP